MRILHWARTGNKLGSFERDDMLLARLCHERGHELTVMRDIDITSPVYRQALESVGARYIVVGESWKKPLSVLYAAVGYARDWKPDVAHLHFVHPLALPVLRLTCSARLYVTFRSAIEHRVTPRTILVRKLYQAFVHRLLAVSDAVRRDMIRAGVRPGRISTLYNGVDIEGLSGSSESVESPLPTAYGDAAIRKVITVGRFFPVKGMLYSMRAAVEVLRQFPDVVWWVVGKAGPDTPAARQIVRQSGLEKRLILLGQRNDVPALMKQASLQVVGSRSEGFPRMVLEASVMGVPTVAPAVGGIPEAILDGVTGLLVPPASHEGLARAAIRLLANDEERRAMGAKAASHVREHFDARRQMGRLLDIYESDRLDGRMRRARDYRKPTTNG